MSSFVSVQQRVRDQALESANSLKELEEWQSDIKKKEAQLKPNSKAKVIPPPRSSVIKDDKDKPMGILKNKEVTQTVSKNDYSSETAREEGNEYFKKGNFSAAIVSYTRSIELDSKSPLGYSNRALAYLKTNQFELAERDCSSSIFIEPSSKAYFRRGLARKELNKLNGAQSDLEMAHNLNSSDKQILMELDNVCKKILNFENSQKSIIAPSKESSMDIILPLPNNSISGVSSQIGASNSFDIVDSTTTIPTKARRRINIEVVDSSLQRISSGKNLIKTDVSVVDKDENSSAQSVSKSQLKTNIFNTQTQTSRIPKTMAEFEKSWNSSRSNLEFRSKLLLLPNLYDLIGVCLDGAFMTDVSEVFEKVLLPKCNFDDCVQILESLSRVERFEMIVLFCSDAIKNVFRKAFFSDSKLTKYTDIQKLEIAKKYRC